MVFRYYSRLIRIGFLTFRAAVKVISAMIFTGDRNVFHRHTRKWSHRFLKISKTTLKVEGLENLNKGESYIYVSNHCSMFDIPIMITALKHDNVRIMYKKELEKPPIFGWAMRKSPFIAVDRSNPRDAMSSIDEALESIRENVSVIIYPEGTRSATGELSSFKRGAFLLAARSGKQLVPVTIIGSEKIVPAGKKEINEVTVKVVIGRVIEKLENPDSLKEKQLMQKVHAIIKDTLAANR